MRRVVVMVCIILAASAPMLAADPAAAHACAVPVQADVGAPAAVTIGVGAEEAPVTEVTVELPEGFRLVRASGSGWEVEIGEAAVHFSGNTVDPYTCQYLRLQGVADEEAKLVFALELQTADGGVVRYDNPEPYREDSAQLLYAGLELPGLPQEQGSGTSLLEAAGWLGLAMAGGAAAALLLRRRPRPGAAAGGTPAGGAEAGGTEAGGPGGELDRRPGRQDRA